MPKVVLTDRFCGGAKSNGAPQTDYFDDNKDTRGLALRVGSTGHKGWTFHFTSPKDGKRARMTFGSYPGTTLAKARTLAIEAHGHLDEGRDPRDAFAAKEASALTVAGLIDSYLEKHVKPSLRTSTADALERRFNRHVIPIIGSMRVADLHRRDVNRVVDPILKRGRQVEARATFAAMRALCRWAMARGDLDRNPMDGMRKPSDGQPRERVLADDEIKTLWHALPKTLAKSKACQRIVKLCLVTGQRVGEVAGMHRGELDLDAKLWTLPGTRTKNGHAHKVPLSDLAVEIINEVLDDLDEAAEFLFPDKDGDAPLPPLAVARTVKRATVPTKQRPRGRFGLDHFTPHDLRRTVLTGMGRLGVAPIVRAHVANHVSATKAGMTLGVYDTYDYAKEKRAALDLWADRLEAITSGDAADVVPMRVAS